MDTKQLLQELLKGVASSWAQARQDSGQSSPRGSRQILAYDYVPTCNDGQEERGLFLLWLRCGFSKPLLLAYEVKRDAVVTAITGLTSVVPVNSTVH